MIEKCKDCEMPDEVKSKNASIKNGCGTCTICLQEKERMKNDKKN